MQINFAFDRSLTFILVVFNQKINHLNSFGVLVYKCWHLFYRSFVFNNLRRFLVFDNIFFLRIKVVEVTSSCLRLSESKTNAQLLSKTHEWLFSPLRINNKCTDIISGDLDVETK